MKTKAELWDEEVRNLIRKGALEITKDRGYIMYKINSSVFPVDVNFLEFLGDIAKIRRKRYD